MRAVPAALLAALALALPPTSSAAPSPCAGEYSRCADGSCALLLSECGRCTPDSYACPLSRTCVATPAAISSCPGLAGTHFDTSLPLEARLDALFAKPWSVSEYISQMTENATAIARLSIPAYSYLNDDQHGVKQPDATAFPNGVSMGASWDAPLLHRVGLAIGVEARGVHNTLLDKSGESGGHSWPGTIRNGVGLTMYAPNVNLVHEPRWGRANEVMSECPLLTGALVAAYVTGLQNSTTADNAANGPLLAVACCKHYAVYNTETIPTDRHHFNAVVGARDLWETYLPVFESCVTEARGQSVMCSYNSINGIPACGNKGMLTTVLRDTLKFDGFVMSDYDAWEEIVSTHAYVPTYAQAAALGINAGLDQEGGGGPTYPPVQQGIPIALADGNITLAQLETSVRRLFRARLRLGMFDPPTSVAYNGITHADVASPEHLALAEEGARAGMTLLKNDGGALPLSLSALKGKRVAVVGPNANASYILLGSYSDPGCCTTGGIPTFLDEFSARAYGAGVGAIKYAPGCDTPACADNSGFGAAMAAAASADAVILVLGMGNTQYNCGGAKDRDDCEAEDYDRTTCALPGAQPALVTAIKGAMRKGVPLIGVLIHGGAFCLEPQTVSSLDALLDAWYPGMRGAAAMADAVIGAFSPAGRSPVTWYASDSALPADRGQMSPYPIEGTSPGITYRFYDPAPLGLPPPVFTFGEGLSYTTFGASDVTAPTSVSPCDTIATSVLLTNTGGVVSDVVVQVFLSQPSVTVPAPVTRLVTFARAHNVAPGASVRLMLPPITPAARAVIHEDGGDAADVYSLAGKRWGEEGDLNLRVVLGEHGGDRAGGLPFTIRQTSSQALDTCAA